MAANAYAATLDVCAHPSAQTQSGWISKFAFNICTFSIDKFRFVANVRARLRAFECLLNCETNKLLIWISILFCQRCWTRRRRRAEKLVGKSFSRMPNGIFMANAMKKSNLLTIRMKIMMQHDGNIEWRYARRYPSILAQRDAIPRSQSKLQ